MKKYLIMMLCGGLLFAATGCGDAKKEEAGSKNDETKVETSSKKEETKEETTSKKDESKVETDSKKNEPKVETNLAKTNNKKLSCSSGILEKNNEYAEFIFSYDSEGKKIEDIKSILKWDESPTEIKDENLCDKYLMGDKKAIKKCDSSLDGYIVILNVQYDADTYLGGREYNKNTPIDELKEIKEYEGYVCKIEEE